MSTGLDRYIGGSALTPNARQMEWLDLAEPSVQPSDALNDRWKKYLKARGYDSMRDWARAISGNKSIALQDNLAALPLAGGYAETASLDLNFAANAYKVLDGGALTSKPFGDIITFTRASGGGRFNSSGVYEWLANDVPRIDYDPVTGECLGLLIEEQRTNRRIYSSNAENWNKNSPNLTAEGTDIPAPLAGEYFQRVSDTGSGDDFFGFLTPVPNNTDVFTGSIYVRKTESSAVRVALQLVFFSGGTVLADTAILDTNTGSVKAASLGGRVEARDCGDTWRLSVTLANNASGNTTLQHRFFPAYQRISSSTASMDKDAEGVALVYGAQLEAGAFPTSYIPTTTAQVTRTADVASVNTLSPWFNASEGTLFAEFTNRGGLTQFGDAAVIDNGTANQRIRIGVNPTIPNRLIATSTIGGVAYGLLDQPAPFGKLKCAISISATSTSVGLNGAVISNVSTPSAPAGLTTLRIGKHTSLGYINSHIRSIRYYPRKLANSELQAITV